jgi:short-subunit dehydrogenase
LEILIISSTSGIAEAIADRYLSLKQSVILCARNNKLLEEQVERLSKKHSVQIPHYVWDISNQDLSKNLIGTIFSNHNLQGVVIATGVMYEQSDCMSKTDCTKETLDINFTFPCLIINMLLQQWGPKKPAGAFISCISSIAGDRGRKKNFTYGAAKAGMSTFLEGLRCSPFSKGVFIQSVKPGPVATKMTAHLPKSPLLVSPEYVANKIIKGLRCKQAILYAPGFWRYIMFVIRHLPEFVLKKVNI